MGTDDEGEHSGWATAGHVQGPGTDHMCAGGRWPRAPGSVAGVWPGAQEYSRDTRRSLSQTVLCSLPTSP